MEVAVTEEIPKCSGEALLSVAILYVAIFKCMSFHCTP